MSLLDVKHVQKIYQTRFGAEKVEALKDIHFSVEAGEYVAIMGESGSGKTTLLNILATLDKPTQGQVLLNGVDTQTIKASKLSQFRRDELGFVFQEFNLLDTLSVKDNIILPLVLKRTKIDVMNKRLAHTLQLVGMQGYENKFPYELSGGQQQRVAIARAIMSQPSLVLADEPTGALDSKSSDMVLDVFDEIVANGQTVLMVTHSISAASRAKRVLFIKDGKLYNQLFKGEQSHMAMFQKISDTLTVMATGGQSYVGINK